MFYIIIVYFFVMNSTLKEFKYIQTRKCGWVQIEEAIFLCRLVLFVPSYLMLFNGLLTTGSSSERPPER